MTPNQETPCLICDRINEIVSGRNPHFVAEVASGYVVLGDFQYLRGYTLLLGRKHVAELHDLDGKEKETMLIDMSEVAESVFRCFHPRKLNYECLGNTEPHLHWHIFPRYGDDPSPRTTSWKIDKAIRYDEKFRIAEPQLGQMKLKLLSELRFRENLEIFRSFEDVPIKGTERVPNQ